MEPRVGVAATSLYSFVSHPSLRGRRVLIGNLTIVVSQEGQVTLRKNSILMDQLDKETAVDILREAETFRSREKELSNSLRDFVSSNLSPAEKFQDDGTYYHLSFLKMDVEILFLTDDSKLLSRPIRLGERSICLKRIGRDLFCYYFEEIDSEPFDPAADQQSFIKPLTEKEVVQFYQLIESDALKESGHTIEDVQKGAYRFIYAHMTMEMRVNRLILLLESQKPVDSEVLVILATGVVRDYIQQHPADEIGLSSHLCNWVDSLVSNPNKKMRNIQTVAALLEHPLDDITLNKTFQLLAEHTVKDEDPKKIDTSSYIKLEVFFPTVFSIPFPNEETKAAYYDSLFHYPLIRITIIEHILYSSSCTLDLAHAFMRQVVQKKETINVENFLAAWERGPMHMSQKLADILAPSLGINDLALWTFSERPLSDERLKFNSEMLAQALKDQLLDKSSLAAIHSRGGSRSISIVLEYGKPLGIYASSTSPYIKFAQEIRQLALCIGEPIFTSTIEKIYTEAATMIPTVERLENEFMSRSSKEPNEMTKIFAQSEQPSLEEVLFVARHAEPFPRVREERLSRAAFCINHDQAKYLRELAQENPDQADLLWRFIYRHVVGPETLTAVLAEENVNIDEVRIAFEENAPFQLHGDTIHQISDDIFDLLIESCPQSLLWPLICIDPLKQKELTESRFAKVIQKLDKINARPEPEQIPFLRRRAEALTDPALKTQVFNYIYARGTVKDVDIEQVVKSGCHEEKEAVVHAVIRHYLNIGVSEPHKVSLIQKIIHLLLTSSSEIQYSSIIVNTLEIPRLIELMDLIKKDWINRKDTFYHPLFSLVLERLKATSDYSPSVFGASDLQKMARSINVDNPLSRQFFDYTYRKSGEKVRESLFNKWLIDRSGSGVTRVEMEAAIEQVKDIPSSTLKNLMGANESTLTPAIVRYAIEKLVQDSKETFQSIWTVFSDKFCVKYILKQDDLEAIIRQLSAKAVIPIDGKFKKEIYIKHIMELITFVNRAYYADLSTRTLLLKVIAGCAPRFAKLVDHNKNKLSEEVCTIFGIQPKPPEPTPEPAQSPAPTPTAKSPASLAPTPVAAGAATPGFPPNDDRPVRTPQRATGPETLRAQVVEPTPARVTILQVMTRTIEAIRHWIAANPQGYTFREVWNAPNGFLNLARLSWAYFRNLIQGPPA